nr:MAG TPA: hypothetical protein [Bacteriophage sp.]
MIVRGARFVWCYFAKYNGGIFYIIYSIKSKPREALQIHYI